MSKRPMRRANGEGCIFKLSGKRRRPWAVRVTAGWADDGKQRLRYLGYYSTQKEAREALREFLVNPYDLQTAELSLLDVYNLWLPTAQLSDSTMKNYKSAFASCAALHSRPIREIKVGDIEQAMAAVKPSRQHIFRAALRVVFQFAMKREIIDRNVAELVSAKAAESKEKAPFSVAEIEKVRAYDHPLADSVLMLLYTGMRISELLELKTADVNLAERYMVGGKKTAAGKDRLIPIHDAILPLVRARVEAVHEFLITSASGQAVPYITYSSRFWKQMKEALGFAHTPHATRHTFITFAARQGLDRSVVQRVVGHKSGDITSHYTHHEVAELVAEINRLSYE